ncbi:MAG: PilZ domain-containing protein [Thermodesulfobacteriota bacterium]
MSPREQRKYIRLESLNLLDYLIIDKGGMQTTHSMGRTLDISENGLKLETSAEVAMGDTLLITIGLEDDLIDLVADVTYVETAGDRYHSGVEFVDISEEGRRIFNKYTDAFLERFST